MNATDTFLLCACVWRVKSFNKAFYTLSILPEVKKNESRWFVDAFWGSTKMGLDIV